MTKQLPLPNRLRKASSAYHMAAERASQSGDLPASRWLYAQSERAESTLAELERER